MLVCLFACLLAHDVIFFMAAKKSVIPDKIKQSAVLIFMDGKVGKILFKIEASAIHPAITSDPMKIEKMPIILEMRKANRLSKLKWRKDGFPVINLHGKF